jgi:hypothetical protein
MRRKWGSFAATGGRTWQGLDDVDGGRELFDVDLAAGEMLERVTTMSPHSLR